MTESTFHVSLKPNVDSTSSTFSQKEADYPFTADLRPTRSTEGKGKFRANSKHPVVFVKVKSPAL